MQFLGGGGIKMGLILLTVLLLNPIVFAIGPILFAFLAGFYFAGEWTSIIIAQCRVRNCCAIIVLAIPLFILLLAIAEALLLSLAALASVLLLCIVSPLLMLFIIYFTGRLTYLNCKRLK